MKDIQEIMKDFMDDYEENPEGWNYWTEKSGEFYDIYILNDDEGYFMKIDSIYTQNPIGKGTKIKTEQDQLEKDLPNFGFRKFTENELENFMYALKEAKGDEEQTKKVIDKKLNQKPMPTSSIKEAELVMLGPFNRGQPFRDPSEKQNQIDKELKKKLKKKFRKERPMYR